MFEGETLTFEQFNKEHERCMAFLRDAVNQSKASKRIIVTHHLPSFQLSSPDFKGSRINGAFVADEDDFIEGCRAQYWIYGHSHRNTDKQIGRTQFVSNQLGYVFTICSKYSGNSSYSVSRVNVKTSRQLLTLLYLPRQYTL